MCFTKMDVYWCVPINVFFLMCFSARWQPLPCKKIGIKILTLIKVY